MVGCHVSLMNMKNLIIVLAVIAMVGAGTTAFAGWGRGWGCWRNSYGPGNLSEEETKKLEEANEAFFKETEELRRSIYEKELALRSEMIKENPDPKKAADLQKEISDLESRFDQKRLERRLEMQKINPHAGRGFRGRGGRGNGYMNRGTMGRGSMGMGRGQGGYGPYNCPWN